MVAGAVTHGPPLGHGDLAVSGDRAGCAELLATVEDRVQPAAHVFGHIHEGYGVTSNGVTNFVNASICTAYANCPPSPSALCQTGMDGTWPGATRPPTNPSSLTSRLQGRSLMQCLTHSQPFQC